MTARGLATDLLYETFLIHYFVNGLAFNKLSKKLCPEPPISGEFSVVTNTGLSSNIPVLKVI